MLAFIVTLVCGIISSIIAHMIIRRFERPAEPTPETTPAPSRAQVATDFHPEQHIQTGDVMGSTFMQYQPIIYIDQSATRPGRSSSTEANGGDDTAGYVVLSIIVAILIGFVALFFIEYFQTIAAVIDIGLTILSLGSLVFLVISLIRGFQRQAWRPALLAAFIFFLMVGFGAASWNILAPPRAPSDFFEALVQLEMIDVASGDLLSAVLNVLFEHPISVLIIGIQGIGIVPIMLGMLLVAYGEFKLALAFSNRDEVPIGKFALSYGPVLVFASSFFLGLVPIFFYWLFTLYAS
jgi:hypothetical protein